MKNSFLTLYLEINNTNFIFFVGEKDDQNNLKVAFKINVSVIGFANERITDPEKVFNLIKEKIYLLEQKLNHTFKEIVLILDTMNPKFINLSGFMKLNGSQILRENITYILNILKSYVDRIETKKKVLHIFNSKFNLDNNEIKNLPVGLFGNFYTHELSFILISLNDHKNLNYIFEKCNLRVKKILLKSFILGANISENFKDVETFYQLKINKNNSKIFFFENNSLKFEQSFKFGTEIIINDISKITSLDNETIKKFLENFDLNEKIKEDDYIDKSMFSETNFRKIRKKLIYEIILARVKEISELIIFKNVNLKHYNNLVKNVFFSSKNMYLPNGIRNIFKIVFENNNNINVHFLNDTSDENVLYTLDRLVHFGWKKEAIPTSKTKKSIIAKFFDALFG